MRYIIVEVPAYTAIEDTLTGERLVTIHTKHKDGTWLTIEELVARKARILAIFNAM